jgi:phosphopantetheine adenylyltransferase
VIKIGPSGGTEIYVSTNSCHLLLRGLRSFYDFQKIKIKKDTGA